MSNQYRAGKYKGRGRGGGNSSNQSSQSNKGNKNGNNRNNSNHPKMLFHPQNNDGGYATYSTVKDEIIAHIQQNYGEDSIFVMQSIEHEAYKGFEKPKPGTVEAPTPDDKGVITDVQKYAYEASLRMEEVEYSAHLAVWLKEKKTYMVAMQRLYTDIFKNYCYLQLSRSWCTIKSAPSTILHLDGVLSSALLI